MQEAACGAFGDIILICLYIYNSLLAGPERAPLYINKSISNETIAFMNHKITLTWYQMVLPCLSLALLMPGWL